MLNQLFLPDQEMCVAQLIWDLEFPVDTKLVGIAAVKLS